MQGSKLHRCHQCSRHSSISTGRCYSRRFVKAASCHRDNTPSLKTVKYAVVGAGLAGIATAWQLLDAHQKKIGANPDNAAAIQVHVFEAYGIAAGGSGAAAGLLHPISPKGKVLWRGEEAMQEALRLVQAAETAQVLCTTASSQVTGTCPDLSNESQAAGDTDDDMRKPFVWRTGMVRPAASQKQVADFMKVAKAQHSNQQPYQAMQTLVNVVNVSQLQSLVPGIQVPALVNTDAGQEPQKHSTGLQNGPGSSCEEANTQSLPVNVAVKEKMSRKQRRAAKTEKLTPEELQQHAGLHVTDGVVLNVSQYLTWLWKSCEQKAASLPPGSLAIMHRQHIKSLKNLQNFTTHHQSTSAPTNNIGWDAEGHPAAVLNLAVASDVTSQANEHITWDAIVVAAGAAACALPGLAGRLPLQLCQGYTLVMQPGSGSTQKDTQNVQTGQPKSYPHGSPSILGSTYISAQGSDQLVVGATKAYGITPEQALAEGALNARAIQVQGRFPSQTTCDNQSLGTQPGFQGRDDSIEEAILNLTTAASNVWPPLNNWAVKEVRSGVRGLPPRTPAGSLPLLGCISLKEDHAADNAEQAQGNTRHTPPVWVIAGLGSRGLVYHAWLAKHIADAVVFENDKCIPPELMSWQDLQDFKTLVYDAA